MTRAMPDMPAPPMPTKCTRPSWSSGTVPTGVTRAIGCPLARVLLLGLTFLGAAPGSAVPGAAAGRLAAGSRLGLGFRLGPGWPGRGAAQSCPLVRLEPRISVTTGRDAPMFATSWLKGYLRPFAALSIVAQARVFSH